MKKCDFNRAWSVKKEGDQKIRQVHLPDDAMLYEPRSETAKSGSAGAFFAGGKYIYKKNWNVTEEMSKQTMILEFEGVYQNAQVLVNGNCAAEHPYGYTNFFVDVTGQVTAGENEITVIADNSQMPNSRWYSGSGIYREVQLYVAGREYIRPEGIKVTVTGPDQIRVTTDAVLSESCQIRLQIFAGGQNTERQNVNGLVAEAEGSDVCITIPNVKAWDDEHPYLYQCCVQIIKDGTIVDSSQVNFGMRTLSWGKDGLLVNGRSVLLRGACIHHDNGVLGACNFRDAEARRVRILKEAGFNAIRSAHNPISKAMLDACDVMGMYVMDETFDMWLVHKNPYDYAKEKFHVWWQQDTQAMISKDYNHPCVVMYSIGNEISEIGRPEGQDMARKMVAFCHVLDQTRPVTSGVNLALALMASFSKKSEPFANKESEKGVDDTAKIPTSAFFNMLMNRMGNQMDKAASTGGANKIAKVIREIFDIPGYNYATSRYGKDGSERPDQATVGAETMPASLYQNWKLVQEIPTMIGDFMWTGWDYLGESGIGTIRYLDKKTKKDTEPGLIISGGPGIIDICGKMRPEVGWSKIIWGMEDKPVIGVDPFTHTTHFKSARMWRKADTIASWSWEGCEGIAGNVTIYSDAERVELLINGKSLGMKKTKEATAIFKKIPFQPGKLEAVGYDGNGREISRSIMESAMGDTKIKLVPEKTILYANGQDLCFLNIDLVGANGITKSSVDQKLTVEVTGAGVLQGYGSARANMAENFYSKCHTTYYGRSLAVIRAGYEPGRIFVKVSGVGLQTQELEIEVQSCI